MTIVRLPIGSDEWADFCEECLAKRGVSPEKAGRFWRLQHRCCDGPELKQ